MPSLASAVTVKLLASIALPAGRTGHSAAQLQNMTALAATLPELMERFDIVTPLRVSHFLAQLAHESDAFKTMTEYASGVAYEGRADLGNTQPGDGPRFKGRGGIELTGRSNYRNFTLWLRTFVPDCPDFERQPELVAAFPWAAWSAIWFWTVKRLNAIAERDDLVTVTKVVNGGRNGLDDRAANLKRAKAAVAAIVVGNSPSSIVPLYRGSKGPAVARLQRALAAAGFYHLTIDEDFGAGTEQAVRAFQKANFISGDGVAGVKTFSLLAAFLRDE